MRIIKITDNTIKEAMRYRSRHHRLLQLKIFKGVINYILTHENRIKCDGVIMTNNGNICPFLYNNLNKLVNINIVNDNIIFTKINNSYFICRQDAEVSIARHNLLLSEFLSKHDPFATIDNYIIAYHEFNNMET